MPISAGILVYKKVGDQYHFLLSHPGGPYFKNKDEGNWGIPKGLIEESEYPLETARREFKEETNLDLPETGFFELPLVRYKNGKQLQSFGLKVDDLSLENFKSNTFQIFWPPKSKTLATFYELDALNFFDLAEARKKIHPVQLDLIEYILKQG